jgi:Mg2+ and Co2+ transporter CorA
MEAMAPVVTSIVQISGTRRSLKEAENVTRLTNLALLFIPLSLVSGLFSMNSDVSAHGLKLYFSVAIPLCVFHLFCFPPVAILKD